jgi:hypothetical protein
MPKHLTVIAPAGRICPREGGKFAGIITDNLAVDVPDNSYYRRLLKEGSLLKSHKTRPAAEAAAKKGGK